MMANLKAKNYGGPMIFDAATHQFGGLNAKANQRICLFCLQVAKRFRFVLLHIFELLFWIKKHCNAFSRSKTLRNASLGFDNALVS
jgi:hypothetical protein